MDIFIAVESIEEAKQWIKLLETLAYIFWAENLSKSHLRFFKGMPPFGAKRTHHVHIIGNSK
ncbi:GrpB family protein [Rickettsiella grylli]|uniref:GrpB family protein n=1 Tax=Rickettsiella grylli TaxID=59196 RepID=UPI0009D65E9A